MSAIAWGVSRSLRLETSIVMAAALPIGLSSPRALGSGWRLACWLTPTSVNQTSPSMNLAPPTLDENLLQLL